MQRNYRRDTNENMIPEDMLKYMLVFFQDIDKRQKELSEQQSMWDIKQDEILHYIENHNLDAIKSCKIVKQIKYVREERRKAKDNIDLLNRISLRLKFNNKDKSIIWDINTDKNYHEQQN